MVQRKNCLKMGLCITIQFWNDFIRHPHKACGLQSAWKWESSWFQIISICSGRKTSAVSAKRDGAK